MLKDDEHLRWLDVFLVVDEKRRSIRFQITDLETLEVSYIDLSIEDGKELGAVLCNL